MDEITLINLLNKICEKNQSLTWKLRCAYHDELNTSIMQLELLQTANHRQTSHITFSMDTGQVIDGKHRGFLAFGGTVSLVDALLDILIFERGKMSITDN